MGGIADGERDFAGGVGHHVLGPGVAGGEEKGGEAAVVKAVDCIAGDGGVVGAFEVNADVAGAGSGGGAGVAGNGEGAAHAAPDTGFNGDELVGGDGEGRDFARVSGGSVAAGGAAGDAAVAAPPLDGEEVVGGGIGGHDGPVGIKEEDEDALAVGGVTLVAGDGDVAAGVSGSDLSVGAGGCGEGDELRVLKDVVGEGEAGDGSAGDGRVREWGWVG